VELFVKLRFWSIALLLLLIQLRWEVGISPKEVCFVAVGEDGGCGCGWEGAGERGLASSMDGRVGDWGMGSEW
jgi:hypothetical protein